MFSDATTLFSGNAMYVLVGLLGLIVGSFINVVVYRLPRMLERRWRNECQALFDPTENPVEQSAYNLAVPQSACPACGHQIRAWENIPVISYLFLRGRCSACGVCISLRYPTIEITTAVLALLVAWQFGPSWKTALALPFTWALLALALIDLETQLLPDAITLPLLWLGLISNVNGLFVPLQQAVLGAAAGYLSLWLVYHLFRLLTGKEGMGYGDFKLLAALGAWFGWQMLPLTILLSSLVGALVGITLMLFRRMQQGTLLPFGPYLAAAGWIAMLWGTPLTHWYLGLFRTG
ncbi:prepilin peptidase [Acidihalobacter ferrooxydans]|nr:A24 family peptidase [Acidihalobacter ferrooxydans]